MSGICSAVVRGTVLAQMALPVLGVLALRCGATVLSLVARRARVVAEHLGEATAQGIGQLGHTSIVP